MSLTSELILIVMVSDVKAAQACVHSYAVFGLITRGAITAGGARAHSKCIEQHVDYHEKERGKTREREEENIE